MNIFITSCSKRSPATVYLWDDESDVIAFPYDDFDYAYKLDRGGDAETIYGDRVSKTLHWNDNQSDIFESDITRETRVLTDLYLNDDRVARGHRILFLDIEVSSIGGFASIDNANKEITSIGCYDQSNNKELMWVWDKNNNMQGKTKLAGVCSVMPFDTEEEMLSAFLKFYTTLKPTILTGWNTDTYDIPYLYHRLCRVFDTDVANTLSPIGIVRFSQYRGRYQIAGVTSLDYLTMYQKFTYARRPSYRLDAIGKYEVDMGKIEYDGTLDTLFQDDLETFIAYNMRDVHIVVALDKKMKLIDLVLNICHVGHIQYDDYAYSSRYIDGTILTYLHRNGRVAPNKRLTGQAEFDDRAEHDTEGYAGAFVQPPMPGLYEWVYNLDLQSLYPSIIMSLNISPETRCGLVRDWNVGHHIKTKTGTYIVVVNSIETVLNYDQFVQFMKDNKFMISSNGILYRSDKTGVIPEILNTWFAERTKYKTLMKKYKKEGNDELADYYDRRQHVQKILLNSIYGVLGLPIFRFYDLDNALAVTATGQDIIKTSAKFISKKCIELGAPVRSESWLSAYDAILTEEIKKNRLDPSGVSYLLDPENLCIYIDTDSVYFTVSPFLTGVSDPRTFAVEFARQRETELNKFYDIMAKRMFFCNKHRLVIKGEAVNSTAFWVAKKRYAMLQTYDLESNLELTTPKMKIKGLDSVRSSFPPAFQRIMSTVLNDILHKSQKESIDKTILEFRSHLNTLPFNDVARNTSVKEITKLDNKREKGYTAFPKGMPAHVKASITYNRWLRNSRIDKQYESIRDEDKIKWTYLKQNDLQIGTMALKGHDDPPELVKFVESYMDYDKLYETELQNKFADFYHALRWGMLPTSINQQASNFFDFG